MKINSDWFIFYPLIRGKFFVGIVVIGKFLQYPESLWQSLFWTKWLFSCLFQFKTLPVRRILLEPEAELLNVFLVQNTIFFPVLFHFMLWWQAWKFAGTFIRGGLVSISSLISVFQLKKWLHVISTVIFHFVFFSFLTDINTFLRFVWGWFFVFFGAKHRHQCYWWWLKPSCCSVGHFIWW